MPSLPALDQAMAVQHGVYCADRRAMDIRVPLAEAYADFWCTPVWILLLELNDQLLDLHRQLVGVAIGPSTSVREAIDTAVFVTVVNLVAGLAGYAELTAETGHLLAIQEAGDKSETFFHNIALLPGHGSFSRKGRKCYPCLRYEVLPLCQEAQKFDQAVSSSCANRFFLQNEQCGSLADPQPLDQ